MKNIYKLHQSTISKSISENLIIYFTAKIFRYYNIATGSITLSSKATSTDQAAVLYEPRITIPIAVVSVPRPTIANAKVIAPIAPTTIVINLH